MLNKEKLRYILSDKISLKEQMEDPMIDPNLFADAFANSYFPVLEGTPYEKKDYSIPQEWFVIYENFKKKLLKYEENCDYMLERNLTKEMFHDHSLFLMKESLIVFSPFSEKAKKLLTKLELLDV